MALSSLFSSLLIFLGLFYISPSASQSTNPVITNICHQTENPAFCYKVLGSDPRAKNADIKGLTQISIELASYNASGTSVKIHSLYLGAKNPSLKIHLMKCLDLYHAAVDDLSIAKEYLDSGKYKLINTAAAGPFDEASDCEDDFKKPPAYPSPLTIDNLNLRHLSEMVAVAANILSR